MSKNSFEVSSLVQKRILSNERAAKWCFAFDMYTLYTSCQSLIPSFIILSTQLLGTWYEESSIWLLFPPPRTCFFIFFIMFVRCVHVNCGSTIFSFFLNSLSSLLSSSSFFCFCSFYCQPFHFIHSCTLCCVTFKIINITIQKKKKKKRKKKYDFKYRTRIYK